MFGRIKTAVGLLRKDEPGRRFRNRYERVRSEGGMSLWARVGLYAAAIVSTLVGIVLVFIPGPAVLFFFIAGGLLASESRPIAGALDWLELKLRSWMERLRGWWRRGA